MKTKNSSKNGPLFPIQYKIPKHSKDNIQLDLNQSQQEINFIKVKLTQAYQKLQCEIQANNQLQLENERLKEGLKQLQQRYAYQKKQNNKLKQTLEVILKNRKILQQENDQLKQNQHKKMEEKAKLIEELARENKLLTQRCNQRSAQIEQQERLIKDYCDRLREDSNEKEYDFERQIALTNKIQILEQQIARITEQKYVEVNRLRYELQLYTSTSPYANQQREDQEAKFQNRVQIFHPSISQFNQLQKFSSKGSAQKQFYSNKQNQQLSRKYGTNSFLTQQSISKWDRKQGPKQLISPNEAIIELGAETSQNMGTLNDDQQLSTYQTMRKKAQLQLCALQRIKRPNNDQREKMARLQRQIYHLDSDIAGLKRKIRRKY